MDRGGYQVQVQQLEFLPGAQRNIDKGRGEGNIKCTNSKITPKTAHEQ
jgi:hypothetical protein